MYLLLVVKKNRPGPLGHTSEGGEFVTSFFDVVVQKNNSIYS